MDSNEIYGDVYDDYDNDITENYWETFEELPRDGSAVITLSQFNVV